MKSLGCFLALCTISVQGHTFPPFQKVMTTPGYATTTNRIEQGTLTQPSGVVTSPGYPGNYPPNTTTVVSVHVPLRSTVEIHFKHFDLQDCYSCQCDYVQISTFNRFCGTNEQYKDIYWDHVDMPYIEFQFHSDDHDERSGFYMTYDIYYPSSRTVPPSTPPPFGYQCTTPACNPNCPQKYQSFRVESDGCSVCVCTAPAATSQTHVGSNSLLLQMLLNLGTEAQALELQAQSVKDSANLAISMLQNGNGQGWRK